MTADDDGAGRGVGARTVVGSGALTGVVFLSVLSRKLESGCAPAGGLGAFLSPAEVTAAGRFRRVEDRLDYAASHVLFRLLAARWLGLPPLAAAGLGVTRLCSGCGSTQHGKPAVEGVSLSLSRSHGAMIAAAGPARTPVGADIERLPDRLFDGFDEFVAAPGERGQLPTHDVAGRLRLWVAKEAVLKAAGLGLAVEPSSVHLTPAGCSLFVADCPGQPKVHGLTVGPVPVPEGYLAAVSAGSGLPPVSLSLADVFGAGRLPR
ncbi:4'-phosphopantetheinyl transferase superfamily protein [Pseudarthrobacter sp. SSS035]|uniref:4'-phosphopantetheinyl transferase family protein n=1 Tax=Pseudarthrobacter sp. SSS035 TaxID=2931399 RepID=UPI00200BC768|nr:4'-phosphopantetheinyl transferase superfamily protein [Pseudarthrobacter sp. SSS035]